MTSQRTLYFAGPSFYSGKALLALLEKKVPFAQRLVNLREGEQNTPWFLKLNPKGQVPLLQDGDKCVADSEDIIRYVDALPEGKGARLIPGEGTLERGLYEAAHALLNAISAPVLTFGTVCNPELSVAGLQLPEPMRLKSAESMLQSVERLQKLKAEHPEMADCYDKKIQGQGPFVAAIQDKEKVKAVIQDLVNVFTRLDHQLAITTAVSPDNWLCGSDFTAVDMNLFILINRLKMLGLEPKYISADLNPRVKDFWERALRRESVQEYLKIYQSGR